MEHALDGSYPISRYLFMYTAGDPSGLDIRFDGDPGAFVCANSSTRTISGFRWRIASVSISSTATPR